MGYALYDGPLPYVQPYPYTQPCAQPLYSPYNQNAHFVGAPTIPVQMSPPQAALRNSRSTSVSDTGSPRPPPPVEIENDDYGAEGTDTPRCTWLNWSVKDDMRLISAWLNNSVDPVDENNQKFDMYWSKAADEYNTTSPRDHRRDVTHCKNH